ncbi:PP2C family protein-serine/threonine phosphatase [Paraburkholderia bonniea]|uniref:PP2C family protein-serine/threonine phosphatase n=1 Tax=Paraburkholderia bonniea TaxID=2152891 RepID=UPI0012929152|nr:PP2C family protein-serine/threonine phosphatase [Paraburkholderia bonniea]WJF89316.1 PP2C family protein-serine/threonine phosphatase [Paraburkholderia bonniea]WJF92632.1 PP2C family protein-serine/threonine phosphatase [Paraburkholderia bonniea]
MLSRNRFFISTVALLAAIGCVCGWFLAKSQQDYTGASQQVAVQSIDWIWQTAQHNNLAQLDQQAERLSNYPGLTDAIAAGQVQELERAARMAERGFNSHPWLELYDRNGALLYANHHGTEAQPLLNSMLRTALELHPERNIGGVVPWQNQRYMWVYAIALGRTPLAGYAVFGLDMEDTLAQIATTTGANVFLVNLRGTEVMRSGSGTLELPLQRIPQGAGQVALASLHGQRYEIISVPIASPTGHVAGALVAARALPAGMTPAERHFLISLIAIGMAIFAGMICVGVLLNRLSNALTRIVQATRRLARLDTAAQLDPEDEELPGLLGQLARHAGAIRHSLMQFELVQDEQRFAWERQEAVIREQLGVLSERLGAGERDTILQELQSVDSIPAGNQLLALSGTLSRLTHLIAGQQKRLLALLEEVEQSVETRAALASLQRELAIAHDLQQAILPRSQPDTRAVQIEASMVPAREIGGDFYAYTLLDENHLALDLGDVSGKGVPAALFMTLVRTLLRLGAGVQVSPAEHIEWLNSLLASDNSQTMFVTLFHGVLDLRSGTLTYVNGGHPAPLLCRAGQKPEPLALQPNPALGIIMQRRFAASQVVLQPGDTLFMYTDGVTEAADANQALFGEERLIDTLHAALAHGQGPLPAQVIAAVRAFEHGQAPSDDIACVSVTWRGADVT